MQFWGYFNRNSSGMHPYDYRQGSYRDGSGGERIRNQEGRQSSNPNMMSDKKKSEDFVVLSLEEIKRRKSENFQAAAETKDHSLASKEGQDEDTPLNTDDHNQNNGAGFGKRGSQSLETEVLLRTF